jgi:protease-4
MGPVAASGGYYVATAGRPVSAERTTITGAIGVFVALPNVSELTQRNGIRLELVKAGGIKGSGSFFHTLSPDDRQTWQDTVDNAYDLFLEAVAAGRPGLTPQQLREEVVIRRQIPIRGEKGNPITILGFELLAPYTRVRADGGTFTATQALKHQLIDRVEDLPAAIRNAAAAAGLSSFKAVVYDRPPGLIDVLLGGQFQARQGLPDLGDIHTALAPKLWYLAPSADAGILVAGRE